MDSQISTIDRQSDELRVKSSSQSFVIVVDEDELELDDDCSGRIGIASSRDFVSQLARKAFRSLSNEALLQLSRVSNCSEVVTKSKSLLKAYFATSALANSSSVSSSTAPRKLSSPSSASQSLWMTLSASQCCFSVKLTASDGKDGTNDADEHMAVMSSWPIFRMITGRSWISPPCWTRIVDWPRASRAAAGLSAEA